MERTVSKYVNNAIASKKKHVYTRLLDYFLTFVVCYLVFTITLPIATNFTVVKDVTSEVAGISLETIEYIDSTHLQRLNKDKSELEEINTTGLKYIENLAKTSAYIHQMSYPVKQDDGTYIDREITKEETFLYEKDNYSLDNLSYYYKKFKLEESSLASYIYDGVDYKDDIDTYQYVKIMEVDASKYVNATDEDYIARGENISRFVVLNTDTTDLIIKKLAKGESTTALDDLLNYLLGTYIKATNYGISDVENNCQPYINIINRFNASYQKLALAIFLIYLVSYAIGYLLLIFIPRLIFKEYKSVGQKVMGVAMSDVHEMNISWWQYLLYYLTNCILFFTSSLIAFLFTGVFGVTSLLVTPHITLLAVLIFFLTFNIISLFMPLLNKRRFDIPRFLSRIVIKDINEYDVPIGSDAKDPEISDGK